MTTYKQAGIEVGSGTLAIGRDVYRMDDVLYAEVVDASGKPVESYVSADDFLPLLIVAGLIIALLVFAFVLMWSGWFLIFFFINGTGFAGRKLKEIVSRRAMLRYTLVVETRTGPVYAYRSSNLLYSKRIAAKINEMVRRRMVSQG